LWGRDCPLSCDMPLASAAGAKRAKLGVRTMAVEDTSANLNKVLPAKGSAPCSHTVVVEYGPYVA